MLIATNDRLKGYAERIIAHEQNIADHREMLKEIFEEAKSDGYTPKALKQAIKIHSMDQDKRAKFDAEQTDLEIYLAQLEGREIQ